jgi:hypothetical protein
MKTWKVSLVVLLLASTVILLAFSFRRSDLETAKKRKVAFVPPKGCVFRTLMG